MAETRFPNGVSSYGVPVLPGQGASPFGKHWFADSNASAGQDGKTPTGAFTTIDAAINAISADGGAGRGDTIHVAEGHAETISGATTLVMDIASVRVIGYGVGADRPTLTYSATDSIINITAANCVMDNFLIVGAIDDIVTGIALSAAADGTQLHNIEMRDGASDEEFLIAITIATTCPDVVINRFRFHGLGGGMTNCIVTAGTADRIKILNSFIRCDASAEAIDLAAGISLDLEVAYNQVINIDTAAGLGIATHNSCTGFVHHNDVANLKNAVVGISGTGVAYCENYCSNALGASGIILPAVDS